MQVAARFVLLLKNVEKCWPPPSPTQQGHWKNLTIYRPANGKNTLVEGKKRPFGGGRFISNTVCLWRCAQLMLSELTKSIRIQTNLVYFWQDKPAYLNTRLLFGFSSDSASNLTNSTNLQILRRQCCLFLTSHVIQFKFAPALDGKNVKHFSWWNI